MKITRQWKSTLSPKKQHKSNYPLPRWSACGKRETEGRLCLSYPSLDPPNILIKASLSSSEAGRELGRDPPPAALARVLPGERNVGDSGGDLVSSANSAEGGREGLGVMTLKNRA